MTLHIESDSMHEIRVLMYIQILNATKVVFLCIVPFSRPDSINI